MILDRIESSLPAVFQSAEIARAYNLATGASLSHFDIDRLGMFERQELILLVRNADLLSGPAHAAHSDNGDE